ncbi:nuclear transport factor 2 family protein [Horticoccus luteus]|uniref:Nuclear transport factor 2 family protein n=1 Tax=Horticoccus luteus TaxID=2862869 RepID=A0A8F9TXG0_9BACT|nr:nuclear transport factor 2 family protein [Horticoccus luteus]QYM79533.1 nuclear transport factor 2 family protein [Horticoccus luteus]
MRRLFAVLAAACVFAASVCAAAPDSIAAQIRTADAARVRATMRADVTQLAPLLSSALTYGYADGRVQSKDEYLAAVSAQRMRYESYDYEEMNVTPLVADAAVATGRVLASVALGSQHTHMRIRFLAVWRREEGTWRLVAYQSSLADTSDKQ